MAIPANRQPQSSVPTPVGSRDVMVTQKKTPSSKIGLWIGVGVAVVVLVFFGSRPMWKQHCAGRNWRLR